jgi:TatA/E family protein of Tat protein translocase
MEGLFQPTHLIFILLIVLILFGPGKLPELGKEGRKKGRREESLKRPPRFHSF